MHKEISDHSELQIKLKSGLKKIASIVKATLGPGGRAILIQRVGQDLRGEPLGPKITKDGVSVANECGSKDEQEDLVIQAIKNICRKTNATAGDGTTTAIVLGEAIMIEMMSAMEKDPSLNPQLVKESVEKASQLIINELKAIAKPIKDMEEIKQVATISANGDESIGTIIKDAFSHVGAEGVVTVDEGATREVTLDIVDGYQINRGAEAQTRFFNNTEQTKFEIDGAALLIFDGVIRSYTDLVPALEIIGNANNGTIPPFIIMANEFSPDTIQFLLNQKAHQGYQLMAIKGPHTTTVRSGYYDDMAVMSGGAKLGNGSRSLSAFEIEDLGVVGKVVVDKYKSTFYDGKGSEDQILKRVDQLKAMKLVAESPYDAQVLNDRLAALTSGIAKISVGGSTQMEIKEKYDRIEDALNASRAAIEEGVVAGGGATLARISDKLSSKNSIGTKILKAALMYPMNQILTNIGDKLSLEELVTLLSTEHIVYDARNKELVNYMESGIIDPVKVTRTALENAVSIAGLLSTAGGAIFYMKD